MANVMIDLLTDDLDAEEVTAQIEEICNHLRKRAREYLSDPTTANAYQLANSVLKHTNLISKERK